MSSHAAPPSLLADAHAEAEPLAWLLTVLREAIVGMMADDQPPLKKANALARLGTLYLKAYCAAELKRCEAEQAERIDELDARLAALESASAAGTEDAAHPATSQPEVGPARGGTNSAESPQPGSPG